MDFKRFEETTQVFTFGKLQDFCTFIRLIETHGFTVDDVFTYVEQKKEKLRLEDSTTLKIPPELIECPECSAMMLIYPVNHTPTTQTGDPEDNSVWICRNTDCMHTIYNKETMDELVKRGK